MDICSAHTLFARLRQGEERPLCGLSIELTRRCNLSCQHCYCVLPPKSDKGARELSALHWERILKECVDLGLFELTITGGEPLLHPGFKNIWMAAKNFGLFVTLFTNGTLIDEDLAAFFAEWTPLSVSVSLYGASEATYEKVTGRSGMFDKTIRGLNFLRDKGITLEVKGVFSKLSWRDFEEVRSIASSYCKDFRWDAELMGSFSDCDKDPLGIRVDIDEYIKMEQSDPKRMLFLKEKDWKPAEKAEGIVFRCGVGRNNFHIDPYGSMHPCLPLEGLKYNLHEGTVKEGWEKAIPDLLQNVPFKISPCQTCEAVEICRFCPAFASLEKVPITGPVPYKCELAKKRTIAYNVSDIFRQPIPNSGNIK